MFASPPNRSPPRQPSSDNAEAGPSGIQNTKRRHSAPGKFTQASTLVASPRSSAGKSSPRELSPFNPPSPFHVDFSDDPQPSAEDREHSQSFADPIPDIIDSNPDHIAGDDQEDHDEVQIFKPMEVEAEPEPGLEAEPLPPPRSKSGGKRRQPVVAVEAPYRNTRSRSRSVDPEILLRQQKGRTQKEVPSEHLQPVPEHSVAEESDEQDVENILMSMDNDVSTASVPVQDVEDSERGDSVGPQMGNTSMEEDDEQTQEALGYGGLFTQDTEANLEESLAEAQELIASRRRASPDVERPRRYTAPAVLPDTITQDTEADLEHTLTEAHALIESRWTPSNAIGRATRDTPPVTPRRRRRESSDSSDRIPYPNTGAGRRVRQRLEKEKATEYVPPSGTRAALVLSTKASRRQRQRR